MVLALKASQNVSKTLKTSFACTAGARKVDDPLCGLLDEVFNKPLDEVVKGSSG
jgi:hypothetical protein